MGCSKIMALSVKVSTKSVDNGALREQLHKIIQDRLSKTQCTSEDLRLHLALVKGNLPKELSGSENKVMVDREINRWYRMDRDFMKVMLGVKR